MALAWTQRREEVLSDCIVSPDVFTPMIDWLAACVVPYQQALETDAAQRNLHRYLQGLLSTLPSKNAEDIATFVDVQRQVIQEFIGSSSLRAPTAHVTGALARWQQRPHQDHSDDRSRQQQTPPLQDW